MTTNTTITTERGNLIKSIQEQSDGLVKYYTVMYSSGHTYKVCFRTLLASRPIFKSEYKKLLTKWINMHLNKEKLPIFVSVEVIDD